MGLRDCPHCGKKVLDALTQCPHCREHMPAVPVREVHDPTAGRVQIRRGMMYFLMAAVFYYFVGGHSGLPIPFNVPSVVMDYILPLMFLAGAGLVLYGIFLKVRG